MTFIISTLALLITHYLDAQKSSEKFGDSKNENIALNSYSADTAVAAVVLYKISSWDMI